MVVVNLYPFETTINKPNVNLDEAIENIDIGGPTLIRSAAKNYKDVAVITNPARYDSIINELKENNGSLSLETRQQLAIEAFYHTTRYDSIISNYLFSKFNPDIKFPPILSICMKKVQDLRYGENPHQAAAFYREFNLNYPCISNSTQLGGKELSYNNFFDMNAAIDLVKEFNEPCCAVIKHTNPCGIAIGDNLLDTYIKAREVDPMSAFGSIVAFNRKLDSNTAKEIIKTYKKRWNIEQGYKDLRAYFGLGKEENRIYEALIAKITLSMFTYNLVSYINRIQNEPQTLGELFRDLECELEALAISMQLFLQILTKISQIENIVKENKDILNIIAVLSAYTQKELGFMCES